MTVGELIERLGGELLQGDPETLVVGVADTGQAKELDLAFGESQSGAEKAIGGWASVAVVPPDFNLEGGSANAGRMAIVAAAQPRLWFAKAAKLLAEPLPVAGIHSAAVVASDARVSELASVGAGAVIGHGAVVGEFSRVEAGAVVGDGVQIGEHCRIYPRVVLYAGTAVGDRVVIHAGAVLGADGFGYVRDARRAAIRSFRNRGDW